MKTSDNAILDNLSSQSVHIEKLHEDNQREEDVVVPEYPKEDHNEMVQRLQEVMTVMNFGHEQQYQICPPMILTCRICLICKPFC